MVLSEFAKISPLSNDLFGIKLNWIYSNAIPNVIVLNAIAKTLNRLFLFQSFLWKKNKHQNKMIPPNKITWTTLSRCGMSRLKNPFDGNADPGKHKRTMVSMVQLTGTRIEEVSFLKNNFIRGRKIDKVADFLWRFAHYIHRPLRRGTATTFFKGHRE